MSKPDDAPIPLPSICQVCIQDAQPQSSSPEWCRPLNRLLPPEAVFVRHC